MSQKNSNPQNGGDRKGVEISRDSIKAGAKKIYGSK